jgi:Protein of unknown function (DUF3592)
MLTTLASIPYILLKLHSWQRVATAAALLALFGLFMTGREKLRKFRTRNWPTVRGLVGEIAVKRVDGGANGVDYWKLTFTYTYTVQQSHSGTYSINLVTQGLLDAASAGLPGKTVPVHYNPRDESRPVLWEDEVWDLW